jgi:hypothetical protein
LNISFKSFSSSSTPHLLVAALQHLKIAQRLNFEYPRPTLTDWNRNVAKTVTVTVTVTT